MPRWRVSGMLVAVQYRAGPAQRAGEDTVKYSEPGSLVKPEYTAPAAARNQYYRAGRAPAKASLGVV